jgi:hypothetical protein
MNVEIGTEAAQFPEKEYINGIFVAVHHKLGLSMAWVGDLAYHTLDGYMLTARVPSMTTGFHSRNAGCILECNVQYGCTAPLLLFSIETGLNFFPQLLPSAF